MATTEITTCDGCGKPTPTDELFQHYTTMPARHWAGLSLGFDLSTNLGYDRGRTGFDLCSLACLLVVARRLNGLPDADELEALFLAPAAETEAVEAALHPIEAASYSWPQHGGKVSCPECGARGHAGGGWTHSHAEHVEMPCGRIVTSRGRHAHQRRCSTCTEVMKAADA